MIKSFGSTQLIFPEQPLANGILAFSTTRLAGHSTEHLNNDFASMNLGNHVFDDANLVTKNRDLLLKLIDDITQNKNTITWLEQVHGVGVFDLDSTIVDSAGFIADAAMSKRPFNACTVMTADCVPILISDVEAEQVCAIHAGWKGLEQHIIKHLIERFNKPAAELSAWIGPAICQQHFEADTALSARFTDYPSAIVSGMQDGKCHIDLPLIAERQLQHLGVNMIQRSSHCTYCEPQLFFSHRRSTHQGHENCGRMANIIVKL